MKKAVLVLSVVVVVALLAVPILAEGVAMEKETNRELSPKNPGTYRSAEKEKNLQMSPAPRPGTRRNAEGEQNLEMSPAPRPGTNRRAEAPNRGQMASMAWAGRPGA